MGKISLSNLQRPDLLFVKYENLASAMTGIQRSVEELQSLGLTRNFEAVLHCILFKCFCLYYRVHKTVHVPPTFHARFDAVGRTYLYRLAVIKPESDLSQCTARNLDALIPIGELHRTYLVR